eukprot:CAMPEP_0194407242 /NCGR_PEP_ID=MMETSP0176-20130528/5265_1 /TAXON_ID=216777 /ORGANISM="Proboscia alata, Strain PI-D3" /LENGTH=981 /DNA_ID=CAMNT_0039206755 /DNA_START=593 /DNA_END=3535 /DNA_ORIENTATION=-
MEERRVRHAELTKIQAKQKMERLAAAKRRVVASACLPPILKLDSNCLEQVLCYLGVANNKIDKSSKNGRGGSGSDHSSQQQSSLILRHKSLYQDSIPSFSLALQHDPESLSFDTKLSSPKYGSEINCINATNNFGFDDSLHKKQSCESDRLLDELAKVGFDDAKFAQKFRKMKKHVEMCDLLTRRIQSCEQKLENLPKMFEKQRLEIELIHKQEAQKKKEKSQKLKARKQSKTPLEKRTADGKQVINEEESSLLSSVASSTQNVFQRIFSSSKTEPTTTSKDGDLTNSTNAKLQQGENKPFLLLSQMSKPLRDKYEESTRSRRYIRSIERVRNDSKAELKSLLTAPPISTLLEYHKAESTLQSILPKLLPAFANHIQRRHANLLHQFTTLDSRTDLTKPHEWYMYARFDRRKIVFHGGPTNSGKTYSAIQRLKRAEKGLYLGPLRLLAAEVYDNLTSQGVYTNLLTGQDKRNVPFATHTAATVEMAPTTNEEFDAVVIDEIQMIADPFRGFAWTRALMGIRCKEIHVCGGMEARQLVEQIAKTCGDDFELRSYERFGALAVERRSLSSGKNHVKGAYRNVEAGDCIVAFSRNDIFAIQREVEQSTKLKCCVIYGSLPPATRNRQARLFNDPDSGYDVMVASDAIGMGLNLNIRRVIFNSLFKSNGESIVQLDHSSVKQIAGRAGRRNSQYPDGIVTCRSMEDMKHLRKCMQNDIVPIQQAGLMPTVSHMEVFHEALQDFEEIDGNKIHPTLNKNGKFSSHFSDGGGSSNQNVHELLKQFHSMSSTHGNYFLCRKASSESVAKWLEKIPIADQETSNPPLTVGDKFTICMSPVNHRDVGCLETLKKFVLKYIAGEAAGLSRSVFPQPAKSFDDLSELCSIHAQLELFLWLSVRFQNSNLVEQQAANTLREKTIDLINDGLANSDRLKLNHDYIKRDVRLRKKYHEEFSSDDKINVEEEEDEDDFIQELLMNDKDHEWPEETE